MNAEEIRKHELTGDWNARADLCIGDSIFQMLREIAAQLAELNSTLKPYQLERIASALEGLERR